MNAGGTYLAEPAFPDDDGRPDPALRAHLCEPTPALIDELRLARLLIAIVPVPEPPDPSDAPTDSPTDSPTNAEGRSSLMAVVSMVNERGQKGLLAFTGLDSMRLWDLVARPVPALGVDVGQTARDDEAAAVVIDVAGPHRYVVTGTDLMALARSEPASVDNSDQDPTGT